MLSLNNIFCEETFPETFHHLAVCILYYDILKKCKKSFFFFSSYIYLFTFIFVKRVLIEKKNLRFKCNGEIMTLAC